KINEHLNSASNGVELAEALIQCRVLCIAKVIDERGLKDTAIKYKRFIRKKAADEYDRYVKPLFKKRLSSLKLNEGISDDNESINFKNYRERLNNDIKP